MDFCRFTPINTPKDGNFKEIQRKTIKKNIAVSRRWAVQKYWRWAVPAVACLVTACNTSSSFFLCQDAVSFTNSTYVQWHHQKLSSSVEETINSLFAVYEVSSYDIYDAIVEFQAAQITHVPSQLHLQIVRSTTIYIPTPLRLRTDIFGWLELIFSLHRSVLLLNGFWSPF